jgi:hypothetical protein
VTTRDSSPRVSLPLHASRAFVLLGAGAHAVAAVGILTTQITWQWQLLACFAIAGHGLYMRHKTAWLRHLRHLEYHDGRCKLTFADGKVQRGEARAEWVTPQLTILRLTLEGQRYLLPIFADGADPEGLRRLRVLLRCRDLGNP